MTNTLLTANNETKKNVTLGIIDQVKKATHKKNRLAMLCGFVLGGFVPTATFTLSHYEAPHQQLLYILVLGGLVYSAKTVFDWATVAFKHWAKALGFVVLIEGVMTCSHTSWLTMGALTLLITINGVACGCNLVMDQKANAEEKAPRERKPSSRTRKLKIVAAA